MYRTIQGVIVLVISNRNFKFWNNYSDDYSLNCTPLGPITITNIIGHKMFPYRCEMPALIKFHSWNYKIAMATFGTKFLDARKQDRNPRLR